MTIIFLDFGHSYKVEGAMGGDVSWAVLGAIWFTLPAICLKLSLFLSTDLLLTHLIDLGFIGSYNLEYYQDGVKVPKGWHSMECISFTISTAISFDSALAFLIVGRMLCVVTTRLMANLRPRMVFMSSV